MNIWHLKRGWWCFLNKNYQFVFKLNLSRGGISLTCRSCYWSWVAEHCSICEPSLLLPYRDSCWTCAWLYFEYASQSKLYYALWSSELNSLQFLVNLVISSDLFNVAWGLTLILELGSWNLGCRLNSVIEPSKSLFVVCGFFLLLD